ncbi:MAG: CBS domain-containing protein [Candidatus Poseidoniaceae archaeon]|jgi:CBS domain-containing protein|nr:CBS domain-containing protein [Candidatus Poseidoniaceae archaeon]
MQEPCVADMSIADEHIVVDEKSQLSAVADKLALHPKHAILVKSRKSSEILGVITAKDIFAKISQGVNVGKMKVSKLMRTEIMTLYGDLPLSKGLDLMLERRPDAIVVVDSQDEYMGYFSPSDYRDATRKLETHQLMSVRLKRSKKAIQEVAEEEGTSDLLDLLLGGNEEDSSTVEVPSMINLE